MRGRNFNSVRFCLWGPVGQKSISWDSTWLSPALLGSAQLRPARPSSPCLGSSRAVWARFGQAQPDPKLGLALFGLARPGRLGSAWPCPSKKWVSRVDETALFQESVISRRRNDISSKPPPYQIPIAEKNSISRRRDASLFCVWISARLGSARLSWAQLGWAGLGFVLASQSWCFV